MDLFFTIIAMFSDLGIHFSIYEDLSFRYTEQIPSALQALIRLWYTVNDNYNFVREQNFVRYLVK